jgi:pimeloyl-ACP methyl ester carboxylesterase
MISRWWWGPKSGGEIWPKDRWIRSFDGTKIRYTLLGPPTAPFVAFCAGFLCPDTYWRYLVPALVDSCRVLVWNYRGVGVSELPRWPGYHAYAISDDELGIEASARDLEQILEAEGIDRCVLVGHSMGAQVILEAYRRHPEHVAGLVSIAGAYETPLRTFMERTSADASPPSRCRCYMCCPASPFSLGAPSSTIRSPTRPDASCAPSVRRRSAKT